MPTACDIRPPGPPPPAPIAAGDGRPDEPDEVAALRGAVELMTSANEVLGAYLAAPSDEGVLAAIGALAAIAQASTTVVVLCADLLTACRPPGPPSIN